MVARRHQRQCRQLQRRRRLCQRPGQRSRDREGSSGCARAIASAGCLRGFSFRVIDCALECMFFPLCSPASHAWAQLLRASACSPRPHQRDRMDRSCRIFLTSPVTLLQSVCVGQSLFFSQLNRFLCTSDPWCSARWWGFLEGCMLYRSTYPLNTSFRIPWMRNQGPILHVPFGKDSAPACAPFLRASAPALVAQT